MSIDEKFHLEGYKDKGKSENRNSTNRIIKKVKIEFKTYREAIIISSFFIILIIIIAIILLLNKAYFGIDSGFFNFIMTIIVGLLTSILASALIKSYVEATKEHEYNYTSSLYTNRMADYHLSTLAKSEGQYFKDYTIDLEFKKEDHSYLRVHRKYKYTKILTSNIIKFRFLSILNDSDMNREEYLNVIKNNTSTSYEFYLNNDYRALVKKFGIESDEVNKLNMELSKSCINNIRVFSKTRDITSQLSIVNMKNDGRIFEIDFEIPKSIFRMNNEFKIRYELDYLIENESYSEIPIKLPIETLNYNIRWESLVESHHFDVYKTLSTQTGLEENFISIDGRIEDTILNIFPNSSFCIIWWLKK